MENLQSLDEFKAKQDDKATLIAYHEKLHALIEVHALALQNLTLLQDAWVTNVDNDVVSKDELNHFRQKHSKFAAFCHEHHDSADGTLLVQQVEEASAGIEGAASTFEAFKAANNERDSVFSNFSSNPNAVNDDQFKNELLKHLSTSIVVKESRHRYQKE